MFLRSFAEVCRDLQRLTNCQCKMTQMYRGAPQRFAEAANPHKDCVENKILAREIA